MSNPEKSFYGCHLDYFGWRCVKFDSIEGASDHILKKRNHIHNDVALVPIFPTVPDYCHKIGLEGILKYPVQIDDS
jgi:hypothetical protein